MAFISKRFGQFTYFDLQLDRPDWSRKDVLDFGGNIGNILRDPNSTIEEAHYWCLDITREAIEQGQKAYPKGHWHFYDRYCYAFNPNGQPHLKIPELSQQFDYIVAYSVFPNTNRTDMMELVKQLKDLLKPTGKLAFTFIDPYYYSWPGQYHGNNLQWRLEQLKQEYPNSDTDRLLTKVGTADWLIIVNEDDLYIESEEIKFYPPEQQKSHYVFHTEKYMKTLFPDATILPPVNGEMQHCCIISRSER